VDAYNEMADPKLENDMKVRLAALLQDLQENGHKDPEAMWFMGSLATHIMKDVNATAWPDFKASLTRDGYDTLLKGFENQGKQLYANGKHKAAFAVQALAISTIVSKMTHPDIATGDKYLDQFIMQTVRIFKQTEMAGTQAH
jgi:hypothetical protein